MAALTYKVTGSPGDLVANIAAGAPCKAAFSGLTNGTQYTFMVTASNGVHTGDACGPTAPVTPAGPPDKVTGVYAKAGDSQAEVHWTAPSSNGGAALTAYIVECPGAGAEAAPVRVPGTANSALFRGLTNGRSYAFVVRAVNAASEGPQSDISGTVIPIGMCLHSCPCSFL